MLKLHQLRAFSWTVKLGSFEAASVRLCVTPSTVSMRIRELERTLGLVLFERCNRRVQLTKKGKELVDYADRMLDLEANIEYQVATPDALSGCLRLGVAEMVSTTWLSALTKEISLRYPRVRLEIEEALTEDLMSSLDEKHLELVLAPGHISDMGYYTYSLGYVQFAWVASPTLGLGDTLHAPQSLANYPVIGLKNASFHHARIESWFRHADVRCHYLVRCKSMMVAASMASAGMGIAYLPVRYLSEEFKGDELEILQVENRFTPVEFVAMLSIGESNAIAMRVADLAAAVSDFNDL